MIDRSHGPRAFPAVNGHGLHVGVYLKLLMTVPLKLWYIDQAVTADLVDTMVSSGDRGR